MTGGKDSDRTAALHSPVPRKDAREVRVRIGALTDPGLVRSNNEDSFVVSDLSDHSGPVPAGEGPPEPEPGPATVTAPWDGGVLGPRGVLLAVSDGMGGHSAGEVASGLAVQHLREQVHAEWGRRPERDAVAELRNDLRVSVDRANKAVLAHAAANPESEGMGATLTAVVVAGSRMVIAHVGDSRCYLLREGFLKCLTSDQSLAEELFRRGIVERGSPAYLARRSVLTRVIGQKGILEPDLDVVDLARGDRVLLCSDGLYGPVSDDVILEVLDESGSPGEAVAALVAEARSQGAPDNVTCVAMWLDGEGLPVVSETGAGDGTMSVAIDSTLLSADDATLSFTEFHSDGTGEFAAAEVDADDTLAGTVIPVPPAEKPVEEPAAAGGPAPGEPMPPAAAATPAPAAAPATAPATAPAAAPPSPSLPSSPDAAGSPVLPPPVPDRNRRLSLPVIVVLVVIAFALVALALVEF